MVKLSVKSSILLIDLSSLPDRPNVFNSNRKDEYEDSLFPWKFNESLSKEICKDVVERIEYLLTKVVAEYFRHSYDFGVDGFIFSSSRNTEESNGAFL